MYLGYSGHSIFKDSKLLSDPIILIHASENIITVSIIKGPAAWLSDQLQVVEPESICSILAMWKSPIEDCKDSGFGVEVGFKMKQSVWYADVPRRLRSEKM